MSQITLFKTPSLAIPAFADASSAAAWLKTEVAATQRHESQLVIAWLRIGTALVMIRDLAPRGTLSQVYKLSQLSDRTLQRYLSAAEHALKELGLISSSGKLTDKAAPSAGEILLVQPDLFDDPARLAENKLLAKMAALVGQRSLSQWLKEKKATPQLGDDDTPKKTLTADELTRQAEDEIAGILTSLNGWFLAAHHARISKDKRVQLIALLEEAESKLKAVKD